MKLLVGLGNPGDAYRETRHNLGFRLAERVASKARAAGFSRSGKSLVSRGRLCGQPIIIAKPQTYMNLSGRAVAELIAETGACDDDLIVAHDDLDIELGSVRVKQGGGHGGHRGLESILAEAPAGAFVRIRLGIKPEASRGDAAEWVLADFGPEESERVEAMLETAERAVEALLSVGVSRAMSEFNRRRES